MQRSALGILWSAMLFACAASPPPAARDAGARPVADAGRDGAPGPGDGGLLAGDAGTGPAPDAAPLDGGSVAICPPEAPYGSSPGATAADLVLLDCDGVEHSLHDLCERQVVWLFEYADWCPPCRSFASSDANRVYRTFSSESFAAWMVISEDSGFRGADAMDCATIRERYAIELPVLFDPTGALQRELGVQPNEVHVVLTEGARIDWIGEYGAGEVEDRIREALAR